MLSILTLLSFACSVVALGLFIFIMRFAVRTEVVITTAILVLVTATGLFSWSMLSSLGPDENPGLWMNIAYLCAILMFPLLITLFMQRSSSDYFYLMTAAGRAMVFGPFITQLFTHFLLPEGVRRFTDFTMLVVWLVVSFAVWRRLHAAMRSSTSEIRRDQLEFMLTSFFAVLLFNAVMLLGSFVDNIGEVSAVFSMAIAGAMAMTVRGLIRYQMVIGKELLVRNSLIAMLTAVICVASFVVVQMVVFRASGALDASLQIAVSTAILVAIVLSINIIGDASAKVVEWLSPQLKWQESHVKEVFIIHYGDGLVIAHAGAHDEFAEIDSDIVGGMLTAIQNFVRDAFHASEMESLKSLSMGRLRVLIEAKGSLVLALLFTGHEAKELRRGVLRMFDELEKNFGDALAGWERDRACSKEIQQWLDGYFAKMTRAPK